MTQEPKDLEFFETKKPKPQSRIAKVLARWFPPICCWGYGLRCIWSSRWMCGKVERRDRALFPQFFTVWKWGDFAWGVFRQLEPEELNTIIQDLLMETEYPDAEAIDLLVEHLKDHALSSPFESRQEIESLAVLAAVAERAGYQEDAFPIEFGWSPNDPAPATPDVLSRMRERSNAKRQAAKTS